MPDSERKSDVIIQDRGTEIDIGLDLSTFTLDAIPRVREHAIAHALSIDPKLLRTELTLLYQRGHAAQRIELLFNQSADEWLLGVSALFWILRTLSRQGSLPDGGLVLRMSFAEIAEAARATRP